MSCKKEQVQNVKNEEDDYWGRFIGGWSGLSLSILAILWGFATSPKYKLIDGFESSLLNVIPAIFALTFLTFGIVGQYTKIGRFITYFIWVFLVFSFIQDPSILVS
tara:strand:+ start:375 stop:692 length:318 start_codon:yes stop_codon:yes gene_type:complete